MLIVLLIRKSHPLLEIRPQKLGQASFLDVSQTSGEISLSTTHEHGKFTMSHIPKCTVQSEHIGIKTQGCSVA